MVSMSNVSHCRQMIQSRTLKKPFTWRFMQLVWWVCFLVRSSEYSSHMCSSFLRLQLFQCYAFHGVCCYFQVTRFSSDFIWIASSLMYLLKHSLHTYLTYSNLFFVRFFLYEPTLLAMCSDEIEFIWLCLQVQAIDSLLKLVYELKQSAMFYCKFIVCINWGVNVLCVCGPQGVNVRSYWRG